MRGRRLDRYDYGFGLLGVVSSYLFLVFAKQQGWATWQSLGLLVAVSIPVGLALGWLKARLQTRSREGR